MVSTRRHSSRAKSMAPWWQLCAGPGSASIGAVRVATACRICAVGCGTIVDVDDERVVRVVGRSRRSLVVRLHLLEGSRRPRVPPRRRPPRRAADAPRRRADADVTGTRPSTTSPPSPPASSPSTGPRPSPTTSAPAARSTPPATRWATASSVPSAPTSTTAPSASTARASSSCPQLVAGVQLSSRPDLERASLLLAIGVNTVVSHGHGRMMLEPARAPARPAGPRRQGRGDRSRAARRRPTTPTSTWRCGRAPIRRCSPSSSAACWPRRRRRLPRGVRRRRRASSASAAWSRRSTATASPRSAACRAEPCSTSSPTSCSAAGRVAIETGTGVTMNRSANLTEWLVWALSAVTGSLDRDGGATFNPGFLRPHRGRPAERPRRPRAPPAEPARPAPHRQRRDARAPRWPTRSRPATSGPCSCGSATRRWPSPATPACGGRSSSLDLLVAIDVHPTETTALATHVLPMADHFERADLVTGYLQAKPFLRFAPAVVAPVGERRTQWWIFAELSRRIGLPLFGSTRRDAAAGRPRARRRGDRRVDGRPGPAIRGARCAPRRTAWPTTRCRPGWLVPDRLPAPPRRGPAELVGLLDGSWAPPEPAPPVSW